MAVSRYSDLFAPLKARKVSHLRIFPPAEVISTVVLPHGQAVGGGACVCGRGCACGAGRRRQTPDEVKLQVTNSHGTEVQRKHSTAVREKKSKQM